MNQDIKSYNSARSDDQKQICDILANEIHASLPNAENKIWHGAPVWFLEGNPVAGYNVLKDCVRLLFWSGQSFDEPSLQNTGSFMASEARYTRPSEVNVAELHRWLDKAKTIQWDYKNIVKRKGKLEKLDIN